MLCIFEAFNYWEERLFLDKIFHPFWIAWIMVSILCWDTGIPGSHGVKNRAPGMWSKRYQKLVALISICDRESGSWRLASICQLVDFISLKDHGSFVAMGSTQGKEVKPMARHLLPPEPASSHFKPQLPHPQNEVPPTCLPASEVVRDPTRSCTWGFLLYGRWGECNNSWGWPELGGNEHKLFIPHWNTIAHLFNVHIFNTFKHILSPMQWFPCQIRWLYLICLSLEPSSLPIVLRVGLRSGGKMGEMGEGGQRV